MTNIKHLQLSLDIGYLAIGLFISLIQENAVCFDSCSIRILGK